MRWSSTLCASTSRPPPLPLPTRGRGKKKGGGDNECERQHCAWRRQHRRRRGADRADADLVVACAHADHHRRRDVLRCLRCARHRLRAAGAGAVVEAQRPADRLPHRRRLSRPARRRAVLRLDRRALRPAHGGGLVDPDFRGHECGLRFRVGLPVADRRADHPGFRPGRRGPGRRDLYQRAGARQGPRPFRPVVRIDFSRRSGLDRPGRRLRRAALRLAVDVRDRRAAGLRRLVPAAVVAGIAALAGDAGTPERGASRARLDRARDGKIHRPAAAAAATHRSQRRQGGVVVRSVRPALSAAYACRLGDLVLPPISSTMASWSGCRPSIRRCSSCRCSNRCNTA